MGSGPCCEVRLVSVDALILVTGSPNSLIWFTLFPSGLTIEGCLSQSVCVVQVIHCSPAAVPPASQSMENPLKPLDALGVTIAN